MSVSEFFNLASKTIGTPITSLTYYYLNQVFTLKPVSSTSISMLSILNRLPPHPEFRASVEMFGGGYFGGKEITP
jgi:hypothetical protein